MFYLVVPDLQFQRRETELGLVTWLDTPNYLSPPFLATRLRCRTYSTRLCGNARTLAHNCRANCAIRCLRAKMGQRPTPLSVRCPFQELPAVFIASIAITRPSFRLLGIEPKPLAHLHRSTRRCSGAF